MVAMNSMPQQEVAKGSGQIEFLRANPTTSLNFVVKNPSPEYPCGASTVEIASAVLAGMGLILNLTGRAIVFRLFVMVVYITIKALSCCQKAMNLVMAG
jgi:hypothetical protein